MHRRQCGVTAVSEVAPLECSSLSSSAERAAGGEVKAGG